MRSKQDPKRGETYVRKPSCTKVYLNRCHCLDALYTLDFPCFRANGRVPCQDVSVSESLNIRPQPQVEERRSESGVTLVELIITVAILAILATAALPVLRIESKREKERELRQELWAMRAAIDRYKDAADRGAFLGKVDSYNYPPDLATLVNGVDVQGKKIKFLRRVPTDPMTGKTEWGEHSVQDDPDSDSFGGQNVFDIYSKAPGLALDGTPYPSW